MKIEMDIKDKQYFEGKVEFETPRQGRIDNGNYAEIVNKSGRVRNYAKNAMEGLVNPKEARKEISLLVRIINRLKRE